MPVQRTKLLDRNVHDRDARIFVVATEGGETEPQYFRGLQERGIISRNRVKIEIVETTEGASAPRRVIERLNLFAQDYLLTHDDELWLVIDIDRWPERQLSEVAQEAVQRGYHLAVSNPCFELWLLLHASDPESNGMNCAACAAALRRILGSYDKASLQIDAFARDGLTVAIERARNLDTDPNDRWPQAMGTRVHRLVERLLSFA